MSRFAKSKLVGTDDGHTRGSLATGRSNVLVRRADVSQVPVLARSTRRQADCNITLSVQLVRLVQVTYCSLTE